MFVCIWVRATLRERKVCMNEAAARLADVVGELCRRWGASAAHWGNDALSAVALLPTGTPALDAAIGGVPRGRITELLSAPTSGMTTLALRLVAHAQARGELAVWLDLAGAFDAEYAAACGVDLHALLLAQPDTAPAALELLRAFVQNGAVGVLVVDQLNHLQARPDHARLLDTTLHALAAPLAATPTVVLALSILPYSPVMVQALAQRGSLIAHAAALRLHVARVAWPDDPFSLGCDACVTIIKDKTSGQQGDIVVSLDFAAREVMT